MLQMIGEDDIVNECPHEFVIGTNLCGYCNKEINEKRMKRARGYQKSILPDLAEMDIPEDIKRLANTIYLQTGAITKRKKERKKHLYSLVYNAYKERGRCVNPKWLAKEIGINPGEINRALTNFSEIQTGYRPPIKKISPLDIIPDLCTSIGINAYETIEDAKRLAEEVLLKLPALKEEYPHKVGGGILKYYLEINGVEVDPKIFRQKVEFSDVTIKDVYDRVLQAHNS